MLRTIPHCTTVHLAAIMQLVEQILADQCSASQHLLLGHDEVLARRHAERIPRLRSAKLTSSFYLAADSDSD